ncbi:MAG: hypothetical protein WKG06_22150 [Segetibacter sp.]
MIILPLIPAPPDICGNGIDDNCNGQVDEGCNVVTVTSLILINATTDKDIQTLTDGAVIDLATIPGKAINIRANTSPVKIGSVKMALTGQLVRNQTEKAPPYALLATTREITTPGILPWAAIP